MTLRRITLAVASAAIASTAVLGLAGCGSTPTEHVITINGMSYSPKELEIEVGDTVVWDMTSIGMAHDVVSNDSLFQSELLTEGEFSYTFDEAGVFDYHCTPHLLMTGTITVLER